MEGSRLLQQDYPNELFEARGFCSLCGRFVSRSFPKRVVVSEDGMSHILDQGDVILEPAPHVHIFWVDRNFCVRKVEGIKVMDDIPQTRMWSISGTLEPTHGSNVILLGDSHMSGFTHICGFLIKNGGTIIEALPKKLDNSLITKYSSEQDIAVSILPATVSNLSYLSEWVKLLVKAIENSPDDLDSESIWLTVSYGDTSAGRSPVAVDEKILAMLLSCKHLSATLRPEVKSLIEKFSIELGIELGSIEQSLNLKRLYDEIHDMIRRIGVAATFRLMFRLYNGGMLRIERLK